MMLSDARDYIASLGIAEHVYMGKLPDKEDKSVGVYNSKHQNVYHTALGGPSLEGYGEKYVTLLVHWNKSPRETEKAAVELLEKLRTMRDAIVNNETHTCAGCVPDFQGKSHLCGLTALIEHSFQFLGRLAPG